MQACSSRPDSVDTPVNVERTTVVAGAGEDATVDDRDEVSVETILAYYRRARLCVASVFMLFRRLALL